VKPPRIEAQIRLFKQLDFALINMRQSRELCSHLHEYIQEFPEKMGTALYDACMTGIVVTYALPFKENQRLGALKAKYRTGFPSQLAAETHRDLLHLRDTMFAHRNLEHGEKIPASDSSGLPFYTSRVEIGPASTAGLASYIRTEPVLPHVSPKDLPDIAALLEFQIQRLNLDAAETLCKLGKGKPYAPGTYVVGVDFP